MPVGTQEPCLIYSVCNFCSAAGDSTCLATTESLVFPSKFVPVNTASHDIIDVEAEEIPNVIASGDEGLLSSLCSMICAQRNCVGFSSNVQDDYKCKLYSKVVFAPGNGNLGVNGTLYLK